MNTAGLYHAICEPDNLRLAFCKARRGKQHRPDVREFAGSLQRNLAALRHELLEGTVTCGPYRSFIIHEPKERIIRVAPFRDRVLHHAILNVCEPAFEAYQIHHSYACRKGRGTYAALDAAREYSKRHGWFLKLDVRKYFDSIPHDRMNAALERRFHDRRLLDLLARIIASHSSSDGRGLPIGNLTSQFFANHYLAAADHYAKEALRQRAYVRYMDDMVLWAGQREHLVRAGSRLTRFIERHLRLRIKPWCLNRTQEGVPFLGHVVKPDGGVALSARSKRRYRAKLAAAYAAFDAGAWSQAQFGAHAQALVAVTEYAEETAYRRQVLTDLNGIVHRARTACSAAAVGTTTPTTAAPATATGTTRTTATTTSASGSAPPPPAQQTGRMSSA